MKVEISVGLVNIYLNDEDIRFLDGKETSVSDGAEISIIPAIAWWQKPFLKYCFVFGRNLNSVRMRFTHKIFYKDMVSLLPQTLNDICDHAKEQFPDECCGIILHTDTQEFVRPCRNIQNDLHKDDPDAYPL